MQRILIITLRHDVDSLLIGYGLKLLGAEPTYLFVDELFTQTSFSFRVGATQPRWSFSSDETWHDVDSYSTIWLRRLVHPKVGTNDLHPEDLDRVRENQAELFGQMWAEFCPNARWINSWRGAQNARSKLHQLAVAQDVGLSIPDTLISTSPGEIRRFVDGGSTIFKQFSQGHWTENERMLSSCTVEIFLNDLPSDRLLQLSPGIYQRKVQKASDIRVVIMGSEVRAIRIDTSKHAQGADDWRRIPSSELRGELAELPSDVEQKCKLFMARLGIVFGCFDFVESKEKDGDLVFLEVNESGQFLWMDNLVPEAQVWKCFLEYVSGLTVPAGLACPKAPPPADYVDFIKSKRFRWL